MFDPPMFVKALGIGVAVAAPVGPMSLLCMRTTLARGWRHGLAVGGGIAIGDALYGAVAALGLAGLSAFMLAHQKPLHIAAGLFLIYLGLKSFWLKKRPDPNVKTVSVGGWGQDLATSILLTLTNPPTIIMFAAVFTALAPTDGLNAAGALATIAGVFAGSLLWWCILVAVISTLRHAIGARARVWVDRASGIVLAALGAAELRRGIAT
jgi:threonine/homoserine/homoserine lactone efflux protein